MFHKTQIVHNKLKFSNWEEEVQKCKGQRCTKHQLVLLTILNVLDPKKANNSQNSPQIDLRLQLAHYWTYGTNIARETMDPEIDCVTWIKLGNNMALIANLATR